MKKIVVVVTTVFAAAVAAAAGAAGFVGSNRTTAKTTIGIGTPIGWFYGVAPVGPVSIPPFHGGRRREVVFVVAHGARQVTPTWIQADGSWVYAVDISPERQGEIIWTRRLEAAVRTAPAIATLRSQCMGLLIVSTKKELLFLDVETGGILRRIAPPPGYKFDDNLTAVVVDLDGDAIKEVIAPLLAERYGESAALAVFNSEGAAWCPPILLAVQFATGIVAADVNRDTIPDLVVAGNFDELGEVEVVSLRDRRQPRVLWHRFFDGRTWTPPAVVGDRVYISYSVVSYYGGVQFAINGRVEALDFKGRLARRFEYDGVPAAFLPEEGGRLAVRTEGYFSPDAGRQFVDSLSYIDSEGRMMPGFPIEARGFGGRRVTMRDGLLFQPVSGGYVANPAGIYAFSSENGKEVGRYLVVGHEGWTTDPVVTENMVIFVSVAEQAPWRALLHMLPRR